METTLAILAVIGTILTGLAFIGIVGTPKGTPKGKPTKPRLILVVIGQILVLPFATRNAIIEEMTAHNIILFVIMAVSIIAVYYLAKKEKKNKEDEDKKK